MVDEIGDVQDGECWGGDDPLRDLRRVMDQLVVAYESGRLRDASGRDLVRMRRQYDRLDAVLTAASVDAVRDGAGIADGYADTPGWIAWQSGQPKPQVRRTVRRAEILELVPSTAKAWRAGEITSRAAELIADAHVSGFDDEFQAVEAEFLGRARRRDHRTLATLTRHFRECARADGSKPSPADGVTLSQVGDRYCLRGDFSVSAGQVLRDALDGSLRDPLRTMERRWRTATPKASSACVTSPSGKAPTPTVVSGP